MSINLMKIASNLNIRINPINIIDIAVDTKRAELCAVNLLKRGAVIAVPTDTVYGFACSATNINAINKLYMIKARDQNKPLAICIAKVADIRKWAIVNYLPDDLFSALLPGPITLVLPCSNMLNQSLSCFNKIGVRVPDYSFIRNVTNIFNFPIALTSANISGQSNSIEIEQFKPLWNNISAVFNAGKLKIDGSDHNASTVVDLCNPGFYRIIRSGCAVTEITRILNNFNLKSF